MENFKGTKWEFKKPVHGYYYREYSVGGNNELARDKYKTKYHPGEWKLIRN